MSLQVRPRFTRDIDLAVAVDADADAEALVHGLRQGQYRVVQILEQTAVGRLSLVRVCLPGSESATPEVDLLFASSGIEREIVAQAVSLELAEAGVVRVARIGHLIAIKVLSENEEREQDRADLRALLQVATEAELEIAKSAARLIEERGFNRGKAVGSELQRLLDEMRPQPRVPPVSG
jgi:predicted nucleotidyltransferase